MTSKPVFPNLIRASVLRDNIVKGGRVLVLTPEPYGALGGIPQYNRDVLDSLALDPRFAEIVVLSRLRGERGEPPRKVRYAATGRGSAVGFTLSCAKFAISGGKFCLVYCAHINLLPLAALIATVRRIPLVLAIYGIDAWERPQRTLSSYAAKRCRHVISISALTLEKFQSWAGTNQVTKTLLPNAVHLEQYGCSRPPENLRRKYGLEGKRVIMTFGRISAAERYKGFDEVLDVMPVLLRSIPNLTYLIVGDGSDRDRLERKVAAHGLDKHVIFVGRVDDGDKADVFRLADLYVMPSYGEGFGFVVLEALACGIPVVASTLDGTREALRYGMLGQLVDPRDARALKTAIVQGLSKPKQVPQGLSYFDFANFKDRLQAAIQASLKVQ
jgi:glycosyltransferase involved in cell wall biosynthesis